ncbi:MAG: regulatory protein RecX [Cetobacterium sp.]|uniref:regulatory protein RecX n=1 Tax=Cetobacterium sp. TaxID=2071632 RepID=UPI003F33E7F0
MVNIQKIYGNKIYFHNGLIITLSKDIIIKYGLNEREQLSQEEYLKILEIAALSLSYYLLSKKDYCEKDLREKLYNKYLNKIVVSRVLEILREKGYLDDLEYAKSYINTHNYSKAKLKYMLKQKGISDEVIEELLENQKEKELENLKREYKKVKGRDKDKQIASLMRKGFCYGDIKKIIEENQED